MDNPETLATQGTQDTQGHKSEMDNPLVTLETTNIREYRTSNQKWTIQRNWQHRVHRTQVEDNKHQRIPNEQSEMDNPEKLVTQGTQDTSQGQQTLENTQGAIRNGQS